MESKDKRKNALEDWLVKACGLSQYDLEAITPDASFRRYFRVRVPMPPQTWMAVDAPPDKEDARAFVAIAKHLRRLGLAAPEVIACDFASGFLLVTDFGNHTYLNVLNHDNADELYQRALQSLSVMQNNKMPIADRVMPNFDEKWLWQEWAWYKEWFLQKLLHLPTNEAKLDAEYAQLVASATTQPQVFMHRDYHSANLMLLPNRAVGILDFQDAFIGPLTYDLVSLLRDCYIDWPDEKVKAWATLYYQMLSDTMSIEKATFFRWFDLMGMQRHLKALLTFSRKYCRDGDANYLRYVPRTLHYLQSVSARYPEFKTLHTHITQEVMPTFKRVMTTCTV